MATSRTSPSESGGSSAAAFDQPLPDTPELQKVGVRSVHAHMNLAITSETEGAAQ